MQLLKQGSTGPDVEKLQKILLLPVDGIFGRYTKDAVKKFQLHNNIKVDGIVGNVTWQLLVIVKVDTEAINEDTDIGGQWFTTNYGQKIHKYYLSKSEYLKKPGASKYMFLHHTAGGSNPYACIDNWSRDRRGRVSTEFVLLLILARHIQTNGVTHRGKAVTFSGKRVSLLHFLDHFCRVLRSEGKWTYFKDRFL